jgi:hypothetical protein
MSITVLAPAYYNSLYPVRYLDQSAKRYGIDVHWYGLGKPYPGWYDVQIIDLLDELAKVITPHVLYTDASDAIFLSGLDEIWQKYVDMDMPDILMSKELSGANAGGILAYKDSLIGELEYLRQYIIDGPDPDNPQERWRALIADSKPSTRDAYIKLDQESEIFQVVDEPLDMVDILGGVYNPRTVNYPSILHFAGGYTSSIDGKARLIEPYWSKLGY